MCTESAESGGELLGGDCQLRAPAAPRSHRPTQLSRLRSGSLTHTLGRPNEHVRIGERRDPTQAEELATEGLYTVPRTEGAHAAGPGQVVIFTCPEF